MGRYRNFEAVIAKTRPAGFNHSHRGVGYFGEITEMIGITSQIDVRGQNQP